MNRKNLLKAGAFGLSMACATLAAQAEEEAADTRFYMSANYNFLVPDIDRGAGGEHVGWNISAGKYFTNWAAAELVYGQNDLENADNAEMQSYGINALIFPAGRGFGLYTLLGGGKNEYETDSGPNTKSTYYDIGLGFLKPISDAGSQLRADVRIRHIEDDGEIDPAHNNFEDMHANIGVLIPFGEQTNEHARPFFEGEEDHRFYISTSISQNIADHDLGLDDGLGLQAAIGTRVGEAINMELRYNTADLDVRGGNTETELKGWGIDFPVFIHRHPTFSPYFLGGIGRAEHTPDGATTDEAMSVDFGLGFLSTFTKYRFGIRFDARYRGFYDGENSFDDQYNGVVNLGLHIPIGKAPTPPDDDGDGVANIDDRCPGTPEGTPVDENGCPLDSDDDGVIDPNDACPNTPAGTEVDASGCKIDGDQDGDGVKDSVDECPDTPEGTEVDAKGCPIDLDGDGVINSKDECPDTPEGLEVNNKGCVVEQTINLKGVNFEFNSATLTPNAERILDEVAASLAANPEIKAEVGGHTDWLGSADYNERLSQARADSVKAYLVENGVSADNLSSKGYGESTPLADNETEDGRARNRRVELSIAEQ